MLASSPVFVKIKIKDMDRAIKFYTESLGLTLAMRATGDMKNSWASLKGKNVQLWLEGEPTTQAEYAPFGFFVKGIGKIVAGLKKKGVQFYFPYSIEEMKKWGSKIEDDVAYSPWGDSAWCYDSEGNRLYLFEQPKEMPGVEKAK